MEEKDKKYEIRSNALSLLQDISDEELDKDSELKLLLSQLSDDKQKKILSILWKYHDGESNANINDMIKTLYKLKSEDGKQLNDILEVFSSEQDVLNLVDRFEMFSFTNPGMIEKIFIDNIMERRFEIRGKVYYYEWKDIHNKESIAIVKSIYTKMMVYIDDDIIMFVSFVMYLVMSYLRIEEIRGSYRIISVFNEIIERHIDETNIIVKESINMEITEGNMEMITVCFNRLKRHMNEDDVLTNDELSEICQYFIFNVASLFRLILDNLGSTTRSNNDDYGFTIPKDTSENWAIRRFIKDDKVRRVLTQEVEGEVVTLKPSQYRRMILDLKRDTEPLFTGSNLPFHVYIKLASIMDGVLNYPLLYNINIKAEDVLMEHCEWEVINSRCDGYYFKEMPDPLKYLESCISNRRVKNTLLNILAGTKCGNVTNQCVSIINKSVFKLESEHVYAILNLNGECHLPRNFNVENRLKVLSKGILFDIITPSFLKKYNIYITGGIMSFIPPFVTFEKYVTPSYRYNDSMNESDIDLICYENNILDAANELASILPNSNMEQVNSIRYKFTVSMPNDVIVNIDLFAHQVPKDMKIRPHEHVIQDFHLGCVRAWHDGTRFHCFPSYIVAMKYRINVDTRYIANTTNTLMDTIHKYSNRAFIYMSNGVIAYSLRDAMRSVYGSY